MTAPLDRVAWERARGLLWDAYDLLRELPDEREARIRVLGALEVLHTTGPQRAPSQTREGMA